MNQFYPNTGRKLSAPDFQSANPKDRRTRRLIRELKRSAGWHTIDTEWTETELRVLAYYAGQQS